MTRATGFAEGLFEGDELESEALQARDQKEAYLAKIVACVETALGETFDLRPSKVVAGKEPDKTNAFLQGLVRAASAMPRPAVSIARDAQTEGDTPRDTQRRSQRRRSSVIVPAADDVVEKTVAALQPLFKSPALTPALLGRPPFRFLHAVVSAVTLATGFAEGLFEGDELSVEALQARDQKEAYLAKIVACVETPLGETLDLKPAKVVAGKEPDQTNAFLQALARAACVFQADQKAKREAEEKAKREAERKAKLDSSPFASSSTSGKPRLHVKREDAALRDRQSMKASRLGMPRATTFSQVAPSSVKK